MTWLVGVALVALAPMVWVTPAVQSGPLEYQDDGESGRDADDACVPNQPPSIVLNRGQDAWGNLVPIEDPDDFWGILVGGNGGPVHVILTTTPEISPGLIDFDLVLLSPDCVEKAKGEEVNGQDLVNLPFLAPGVYKARVFFPTEDLGPQGEARHQGRPAAERAEENAYCHPPCGHEGYHLEFY